MEIAGKYKKIAVTEKKTSLKIIYSGNFHQFLCVCSSAGSLNVSATGWLWNEKIRDGVEGDLLLL